MIRSLTLVAVLAGVAHAERPTLADEATVGRPGGSILVHYATSGADAATPAFATEVADTAEDALTRLVALGFRRPISDGVLGGDDRIDIYLRDLRSADGNVSLDACDGGLCIGYAQAENDFAGFHYPSITEGIRSVVPHELFHLIQNAYSTGQSATWSEGSAVWAVEHLYGASNADFERLLPAFLGKTFRPFERPAGGFGDAYPYGASLWPVFLEQAFGATTLVEIWAGCEQDDFLDATALVVPFDDAWIAFTRRNALTGAQAVAGGYPGAAAYPDAPREELGATRVAIEGLSARYVPLSIAERSRIELPTTLRIAATAGGVEFTGSPLTATLEPGRYELVITGLSPNTLATDVEIAIGPPDEGGCATSGSPALLPVVLLRRRRRRTVSPCMSASRSSRSWSRTARR